MGNILQDIIQSEEEALRLEEEAKKQALEILTQARKNAEEIFENSLTEGEALAEEVLQRARSEAMDERKRHESMHTGVNDSIRAKSRQKLDEAANFIVGRVVNKSWQW